MNLASIDLNLLVAFDALMEHRHVTRAGEAIGLSQPAMSNALARLRTMFDDQLLVRTGGTMEPTPRATELHEPARQALLQIEGMVNGAAHFSPADVERTFRIAMAEDTVTSLLPKLYGELAARSPGIRLDVQSTDNIPGVELLTNGDCDIAIGRMPADAPPHIRSRTLFEQKFVCMARKGHPAFKSKLTLERYLEYPHIHVKPTRRVTSFIDEYLATHGLKRDITVSVSLSQVVPSLLPGTDLIADLPGRMAHVVAANLDVVVRELPFDAGTITTVVGWHHRNEQDAGHHWFRELIQEVGKEV